jgi:hypothetical protein
MCREQHTKAYARIRLYKLERDGGREEIKLFRRLNVKVSIVRTNLTAVRRRLFHP